SKDAERIKTSIEDNFREYAYVQADVKRRLIDAYGKISGLLVRVIEKCDVRIENGIVMIYVPEQMQNHVGRLIGRQGTNIRAVEAELGMRVQIRTSPPPEDVELKRKMLRILTSST
ncbi:MAG: KH domain-containing protein, partial [Acidilobaceae archaeon]